MGHENPPRLPRTGGSHLLVRDFWASEDEAWEAAKRSQEKSKKLGGKGLGANVVDLAVSSPIFGPVW
jgi:hypothetical protein